MKIAIIPARGGSKRIPRKNIKVFHGKPMIAYSIAVAKQSGLFDKIIVSTDDNEIAEIAKQHGAEVPFRRPQSLADDFTGTVPVIAHAIEAVEALGWQVSEACCIYPTAPFLQADDLSKGLDLLTQHQGDYSFSATSFSFPIQRAIKLTQDQQVSMFYPEFEQTRSQDLQEGYHDAGQFYWGTATAFLAQKPIFSANSYAVLLPRVRVQDIDTTEDWERAERLYQVMSSEVKP